MGLGAEAAALAYAGVDPSAAASWAAGEPVTHPHPCAQGLAVTLWTCSSKHANVAGGWTPV